MKVLGTRFPNQCALNTPEEVDMPLKSISQSEFCLRLVKCSGSLTQSVNLMCDRKQKFNNENSYGWCEKWSLES